MDVWERAIILHYNPADRPQYLEAVFTNIEWAAVEGRLNLDAARPTTA